MKFTTNIEQMDQSNKGSVEVTIDTTIEPSTLSQEMILNQLAAAEDLMRKRLSEVVNKIEDQSGTAWVSPGRIMEFIESDKSAYNQSNAVISNKGLLELMLYQAELECFCHY